MIVFLFPALLAGLLGVVAHLVEDAADYAPRLRLLFLGSVSLAYLGLATFTWFKGKGFKRVAILVLTLLVLRVWYAPILGTAVVMTGWVDWAGRKAGAEALSGPVHYALGCFLAMLSSTVMLLFAASLTHLKRVSSILFLLVCVAMGVLAFWMPEDRAVLPHPFRRTTPAPDVTGPDYADVLEDEERPAHVRILAAAGAARHFLSPRSGWGSMIRDWQLAQFRDRPDASLRARVSALERALLNARVLLRTSPRTPPE